MALPTRSTLRLEAVDTLHAVVDRLLRELRSLQALLRQIEANQAAMASAGATPIAP